MENFYSLILLLLVACLPAQVTPAYLSPRLTTLYKQLMLKPPVRHLEDLSHLKGLHLLQDRTPLIGLLIATQKSVPGIQFSEILKENNTTKLSEFAKLLFYKNPLTQEIAVTKYHHHLVQTIPPRALGHLVDRYNPSPTSKKVQEDEIIDRWYGHYQLKETEINHPIRSKNEFRRRAKTFLKKLHQKATDIDPRQASSLLLFLLFKNAKDRKDLEEFAHYFSVELPEEKYTEEQFQEYEKYFTSMISQEMTYYCASVFGNNSENVERFFYWLSEKEKRRVDPRGLYEQKKLEVPKIDLPYKGNLIRPLCTEETIRTLINTLLYNPQTRRFDSTLLPVNVQKSCLAQLVTFMNNCNEIAVDPKKQAQEWLSLVSEIPDIKYLQNGFEIQSDPTNALKVLSHLFGIPSVSSYQELGQKLSTAERAIELDYTNDNRDVAVFVDNPHQKNRCRHPIIKCHFEKGHAHITFFSPELKKIEQTAYWLSDRLLLTGQDDPLIFNPFYFLDIETIAPDELERILKKYQEEKPTLQDDTKGGIYRILYEFLERAWVRERHDLVRIILPHIPNVESCGEQLVDHIMDTDPSLLELLSTKSLHSILTKAISNDDAQGRKIIKAIGAINLKVFNPSKYGGISDCPGFHDSALLTALKKNCGRATVETILDLEVHIEDHWYERYLPGVFLTDAYGCDQSHYRDNPVL